MLEGGENMVNDVVSTEEIKELKEAKGIKDATKTKKVEDVKPKEPVKATKDNAKTLLKDLFAKELEKSINIPNVDFKKKDKPTWVDNVIKEHKALCEMINKLEQVVPECSKLLPQHIDLAKNNATIKVEGMHRDLLIRQHVCMSKYKEVLVDRIKLVMIKNIA